MLDLRHTFEWTASPDPDDETFGDAVTRADRRAVDEREPTAVLVGEPYDGGVVGRQGAREGPRALREQLSATKTHHFDAGPVGDVLDLGDVAVRGRFDGRYRDSTTRVQQRVAELTADVHERPALPVFLGGDNSLTYANVRPLLGEKSEASASDDAGAGDGGGDDGDASAGDGGGDEDDAGEGDGGGGDGETVGVVSFDAHLDCRALHDGPSSGTPYRQLLEAGLDALSVVGARHFETSTAYHDYLREQDGTVVTAEECTDPVAAVDRALPDTDRVYVSVDLDVLDGAAAPGVSAPTPGGVSSRELFRMLRLAASDDRLAGLEVVECSPRHDAGDRTARAGARAVAHALAARGGRAG